MKTSKRTPDKIRQAQSKSALVQSGGKRVCVNLPWPAVLDLAVIQERDGTDNTQSIIAALANFASKS